MPEATSASPDDPATPPPPTGRPTGLPRDLEGTVIGGCTITRGIAVGGMGVVYEARQDPPARTVVLKLLRTALATDEGLARFEREARTLAVLRHPAIAQIYGAGTHVSASGERLPYFVMEHVPDARGLVEFASQRRLGLRARLALFVRVCDAVQFGHAKGVIHRDLKPANILVDGEGNPKVIDFGIARTTEDDADESVAKTETGQLVGTLPYMSPEQVMGRRSDVDTRSDVYALGVVLYELLTGRLPYDLAPLNLVEAAAVIAFKPALPPSRFAPETAGDLTVILQKALAKDPAERYASASALGKDVERFLAFTPIEARPPSLAYQLRLFSRRNRVGFLATVGAVLALVAATVVSTLFARSEARQREAAQAQSARAERLLRTSMEFPRWVLRDLDPELAGLRESTATRAKIKAKIASDLDALMATEPDDPELLRSVAESYWTLGDFEANATGIGTGERTKALASYGQARTLYRRLRAMAPEDADVQYRLVALDYAIARSLVAQGRLDEAKAPLEAALAALEAAPAGDAAGTRANLRASAQSLRADLAWGEGRYADALVDYERVRAHWRQAIPADTSDPAEVRRLLRIELSIAETLGPAGKPEAIPAHVTTVQALAERLKALQPTHESWMTLATTYRELGDLHPAGPGAEQAIPMYEQALTWATGLAERDPTDSAAAEIVVEVRSSLASALDGAGRLEDAVRYLEASVKALEARVARDPKDGSAAWNLMVSHTRLGGALRKLRRFAEAGGQLDLARAQAEAYRAANPTNPAGDVHLSEIRWEEGELARSQYDPEAPLEQQIAFIRTARARYAEARDLLAGLEQAGRLPADRKGNHAHFRDRVERITEALEGLEAQRK